MLAAYRQHAAERAALGIPPLPLDAKQVAALIELIKAPPAGEEGLPAGPADAPRAAGRGRRGQGQGQLPGRRGARRAERGLVSKAKATELLGTMVGGYNVHPLIELLDDAPWPASPPRALKKTLLMFDFFNDVAAKAKAGNAQAKEVMQSWADAEWFTTRPEVPRTITVTVFKVPGETNTDDLSPAPDAWSRPDIPLHYLAMLKNTRPGAAFKPEEDGKRGPMKFIDDLKKPRATWWPTWATWWAPAAAARAPPTAWSGPPGRTSPSCPTSASAASRWAARSRPSSSTRKKTVARCPSRWTWAAWKWATCSHPPLRRQDPEKRRGRQDFPAAQRRAV
jgi:hypothetical protein